MGKTLLAWLLILTASSLAFGQTKKTSLSQAQNIQSEMAKKVSAPSAQIPLEGPVDPDAYILGPGDELQFQVWGSMEMLQVVKVGPDGSIAIPTVGNVIVSGKSVTDVKQVLIEKTRKVYPNSEIAIRLSNIRSMKVIISGAVYNPGVYTVEAVDRLSKLIDIAGGFIESEKEAKDENNDLVNQWSRQSSDKDEEQDKLPGEEALPSLRHLILKGKNGSEREIDYLCYLKAGNIDYNPVLKDGDRVHIPFKDTDTGVINIFGMVKEPGEFEYVSGDRLSNLIQLAGGFKSDALLSDIQIIRFSGDDAKEEEIHVNFGSESSANNPALFSDDRIFVRKIPEYRNKYHVEVNGEVLYPGVYSISENSTPLSEIIDACGGFTDRANLNNATVIRKAIAETEDPEYERLKKMMVAEMREMEYEYFKTRSREEAPAVVVDFHKLFVEGDAAQDVKLRNGDVIDVPVQSPTVNVTGQVNRPGLIRWIPGKNIDYYVDKAGGFSWNARKSRMRLIKAQTGMWVKPKKNTPIEIGDTIFVPEKQEIDYWEMWKDILLVVSQIATVVLVIQSVGT